jgi:hypothetical protein
MLTLESAGISIAEMAEIPLFYDALRLLGNATRQA